MRWVEERTNIIPNLPIRLSVVQETLPILDEGKRERLIGFGDVTSQS